MAVFDELDDIAVTERVYRRLDKAGLLVARFQGTMHRKIAVGGILGDLVADVADLVLAGTPFAEVKRDLQARAEELLHPKTPLGPEDKPAKASDTAPDASSLSDPGDGGETEDFDTDVDETSTQIRDADSQNDNMRKALRIADLINLNMKPYGTRIKPDTVYEILKRYQHRNEMYVLREIHNLGYTNFEAAAIAIMQNSDVYIHVMAQDDMSGSDDDSEDDRCLLMEDGNSKDETTAVEDDAFPGTLWQSQEQRDQSRKILKETTKELGVHPSGHEPQEHETIVPHPKKPGRWIIVFRRELPNGDVYEQQDNLPERNMLAEPPQSVPKADRDERKGHPNYFVLPLDPSIPKFSATENSPWKKDGKSGYKRFSKKHHAWMRCTPKLILRKFEKGTNRYVEQFRWGTFWEVFDADDHAGKFDINNKDHWQELNKWIIIVRAAWDSAYTKRDARKTWTKEEMVALYGYFNDLIQNKGLVVAAREWKASDATNAINTAMKAIDPHASSRSVDATHAMSERDTREDWDPDRGIKDWILIGKELAQWLEEGAAESRQYTIPESVLMPAAALNTDTVEGTLSGAAQTQRNKKRMLELGLDPDVVKPLRARSKLKAVARPKLFGKYRFTYLRDGVVHIHPKDMFKPAAANGKDDEESSEMGRDRDDDKDGHQPKRRRIE